MLKRVLECAGVHSLSDRASAWIVSHNVRSVSSGVHARAVLDHRDAMLVLVVDTWRRMGSLSPLTPSIVLFARVTMTR